MKKQNYQSVFILTLTILLILGCKNLTNGLSGSASIENIKVSTDKEGKFETRNFKSGETIFAKAQVSGNTSKAKILFSFAGDHNQTVKGSEMTIELEGSQNAFYSLKIPPDLGAGRFFINAELITDEKSSLGASATKMTKAIQIK